MQNQKISHITKNILDTLPSPCWLLEEHLLELNLQKLSYIKKHTDAKILLALKGYAISSSFGVIREYLDGCCASGLHEAILSEKKFGLETHTYSPAYKKDDIEQIAQISNHIVFNSLSQLEHLAPITRDANSNISIGLRVNPEVSLSPVELYNPCGINSRLGVKSPDISNKILKNINGLHFHALCEQDASSFQIVLSAFEEKFGSYLDSLEWVNFGGGHHITKDGYELEHLITLLNDFKSRHPHLKLYLEPGEAIGWETGVLVATVLDIIHNNINIAILDISAEAHMPDTIIMPYRANVRGAGKAGEKEFTYQLAGNSCLAGDIMGDYSFDSELQVGDKVIFEDQMHYTMVKSTTFNGVALPAIATLTKDDNVRIEKEFGYDEYVSRLG